ncbi:MAG TPA: hypothetical protein VGE61_04020, partial [Glycomyces sp.]
DHARLECRARPWYGDVRESPSVAAIPLMPDGVFAINYNTFSSRAATKIFRLWITSVGLVVRAGWSLWITFRGFTTAFGLFNAMAAGG